jgi:hypothetical protein
MNFAMVGANGAVSTTFGNAGYASIAIPAGYASAAGTWLSVDSLGRIWAAASVNLQGSATSQRLIVSRLTAAGTPDTGWGTGGIVQLDWGRAFQTITSAVVRPNGGGMLVAGWTGDVYTSGIYQYAEQYDAEFASLAEDGSVDRGFGVDGRYRIATANNDEQINDLRLLDDGRVIATGRTTTPYDYSDVMVLRLMPPALSAQVVAAGSVDEGATQTFNASVAAPAGTVIAAYEWDFDYDGTHFDIDATGSSVTRTFDDGPATRRMALRVRDTAGATAIGSKDITIANVAPTATLVAPLSAGAGQSLAIQVSGGHDISDADMAAGFRYSFDLNDDGDFTDPGEVALVTNSSITTSFASAGSYTVHARITDKDGGASDYRTTIEVAASGIPVGPATLDVERRHVITIRLPAQIHTSIQTSFITVENRTAGTIVPAAAMNTTITNTDAVVTYTGNEAGVLSEGRYRLTLHADQFFAATGLVIDGNRDGIGGDDFVFDFFVMAADANHDATVDFADLVSLAQNYGLTGRTFSQGNFDYSSDGRVDFADLVILAQRYGQSLPAIELLGTRVGVKERVKAGKGMSSVAADILA